MNMTSFMSAMTNPQAFVMQHFMQQMIQENPDKWKQAQQMFANKNRKQQVAELRKLYQSKGMDLDTVAKQYGVAL